MNLDHDSRKFFTDLMIAMIVLRFVVILRKIYEIVNVDIFFLDWVIYLIRKQNTETKKDTLNRVSGERFILLIFSLNS